VLEREKKSAIFLKLEKILIFSKFSSFRGRGVCCIVNVFEKDDDLIISKTWYDKKSSTFLKVEKLFFSSR